MKKIKYLLLAIITMISFNTIVKAEIIENDNYTSDTYIIGYTKFNDLIITGEKSAIAGNDFKSVNTLLNRNNNNPKVYYKSDLDNKWYIISDDTTVLTNEEELNLKNNLEIFFVNNKEKELEINYTGIVDDNSIETNDINKKVIYDKEKKKFIIPATIFNFKFKSNNRTLEVNTINNSTNEEKKLNYGEFLVKENNITNEEDFDSALQNKNSDVIVLGSDITLTKTYEIDRNIIIDLNGFSINGFDSSLTRLLKFNGNINATITGTGSINTIGEQVLTISGGATLNINEFVTIENKSDLSESYGIYIRDNNSTLNNAGTIILKGYGAGISGNGKKEFAGTIINLSETTNIIAPNGGALYLPQAGTCNINGGYYSSNTGIAIKAGNLNINSGTIETTGAKNDPEVNNNGFKLTGDAIYIEENVKYADNVNIYIDENVSIKTNGYFIREYNPTNTLSATVTGKYDVKKELTTNVVIYEESAYTVNNIKYSVNNLKEALLNSSELNPVILLKNTKLNDKILINNDDVSILNGYINLNGFTLTGSDNNDIFVIKQNNANLTIYNGNLVTNGIGSSLVIGKTTEANNIHTTVKNDVYITAPAYPVFIGGNGTVLDFYGNIKVTNDSYVVNGKDIIYERYGISSNGSVKTQNTTLNIYDGATIDSQYGTALYIPQTGITNIYGGNLTANTVIGIKSGNLNINGGNLTATGIKQKPQINNNGINLTGDVIIIEENEKYADNVNINITNGKFNSNNGFIVQEYNPTKKLSLTITGLYSTIDEENSSLLDFTTVYKNTN